MAFNYISFIVAKQTQTIQSLFFSFVIIQSLHSLLLYSSCHLSVSFIQSSVLILPSLSLSYQVICTRSLHKPSSALSLSQQVIHLYSFWLLASMDNLISQNGENAVNKLHGKSHTPRKVGFCYYCQVFYPNGKTKYEVTQKKTHTMKRSFSMTSGDRTIIFMLSLLGLSSKHNK